MNATGIDAIEGIPLGLTECSSVPGVCAQERGCAIRGNWQKISLAVRGALEGVTLADLVLPPPGPVPLLRMDKRAVDAAVPHYSKEWALSVADTIDWLAALPPADADGIVAEAAVPPGATATGTRRPRGRPRRS